MLNICVSRYLLKRTLGLDAFPSDKDPVISEAQVIDSRASQVSDELPGFIIESAEHRGQILFHAANMYECISKQKENKVLTLSRDRQTRPSSRSSLLLFPSGI